MKNEIKELIRLFEKLKKQAEKEGIDKDNINFYQNIDMLIGAYDFIKDDMPDNVFEEFNSSLKDMIKQVIIELKNELGENINTNENMKRSIEEIDKLLTKSKLTSAEIDKLLDERLEKRKEKG